jgi:hypothetical protein
MYSEAAACMHHNMCIADHTTPSFYVLALPCPNITLAACLIFLTYSLLQLTDNYPTLQAAVDVAEATCPGT